MSFTFDTIWPDVQQVIVSLQDDTHVVLDAAQLQAGASFHLEEWWVHIAQAPDSEGVRAVTSYPRHRVDRISTTVAPEPDRLARPYGDPPAEPAEECDHEGICLSCEGTARV